MCLCQLEFLGPMGHETFYRHPYGPSLILWWQGKLLVWDTRVVGSLESTSGQRVGDEDVPTNCKVQKILRSAKNIFSFVHVAAENLSAMSTAACQLVNDAGHELIVLSGGLQTASVF